MKKEENENNSFDQTYHKKSSMFFCYKVSSAWIYVCLETYNKQSILSINMENTSDRLSLFNLFIVTGTAGDTHSLKKKLNDIFGKNNCCFFIEHRQVFKIGLYIFLVKCIENLPLEISDTID